MTIKKLAYLILIIMPFMWAMTNALTVPSNIAYYLPIKLTNNQGALIAANTPISLNVNALEYQQYYFPNLQNAELFFGNGTVINSWLEGNASNEIQRSNLYLSSNIIYWLNYSWPSTFLPANTGIATTNNIYLGWAGNSITAANTLINNFNTGESPFLSNYWGEYDDGKNVFSYYTNFAGNSLPTSWYSSGNVIVDNGLTITGGSGSSTRAGIGGQYMGLQSNPLLPSVGVDFYGNIDVLSNSITAYPYIGLVNNSYSIIFQSNIQSSPQSVFQVYNGISGTALLYQYSSSSPYYFNNPSLFSIQLNKSGTNFLAKGAINYTKETTSLTNNNLDFAPNALYSDFEGYIGSANTVIEKIDWMRVRNLPPNGVMPAASFGNIIKPFTVSISAPSNTSLDVGQLACVTADVSGSASPFTYNFLITRTADHTANEAQNSYTNINSNSQTNCNTVQNYMVSASPLIENATVTNSTQVTRASPYSSEFNVYNAPSITISPINTTIDAGQYATFEANIPANEGVGPFTVNLVAAGNTLDTKTIPAGGGNVILSYKTDATTPNTFNVIAVDEGTSTPFTFNSISNTITINPELATPSAPILPSRPIDAGQVAATSQLPSQLGGTGTVTYYWYYSQNGIAYEPANSVQCELPSNTATASSNVECKTNIQIVPGSYFFKIYMTDSAPTPVTTASSATNSLSINSQLTPTNIISPSGPVTMDVGQSQEIHINPPTTGTPEYTYSWSNNSQCPGISSPGNVSSFSYVPNAISSGCQFKVNVTDSASVQESYTANSPLLTVNNPPILTITPSANSINVNGNIIISNSIESGTPPYSTLVLTTNAPSGGYSISGNTIYFNSIGNFSIKGTITDSANFVEANAINVRVNGTIYGKTANVIAVLSANKHSNITYKNANLSLNILPSNDVNAGIFISNITDKNIPLPSLSGANLSKIIALNITITSGANSIESENVIFGSVCQYGSGILPYSFSNGIWTEINHFTLNSSSCTIAFPISPDPIVALFKETQFNSQSGGGSPPKNIQVRISDNVNSTESNQTVLTVYNSNITYSYNQDQLPVNISHVLYNSLQILFSCKFTSGKIEYTYAGMIVGLGSGYPCNSRILLYSSGNYSAIYSSAETPQTITTSVSSTSTTSASTSTISISTTALTTSATTTALPAIPPKQKVQNGYLTDAAAIVAIIIISAILIRALKRGSINKNKTKK